MIETRRYLGYNPQLSFSRNWKLVVEGKQTVDFRLWDEGKFESLCERFDAGNTLFDAVLQGRSSGMVRHFGVLELIARPRLVRCLQITKEDRIAHGWPNIDLHTFIKKVIYMPYDATATRLEFKFYPNEHTAAFIRDATSLLS